jgi:hypothetical protein
MFNKDVLDALIREFGVKNAILYCKMESRKSELMLQDSRDRGEIGSSEWEYERDFWKDNETELSKNTKITKHDDFIRVTAKQPKDSHCNKTVVLRKTSR